VRIFFRGGAPGRRWNIARCRCGDTLGVFHKQEQSHIKAVCFDFKNNLNLVVVMIGVETWKNICRLCFAAKTATGVQVANCGNRGKFGVPIRSRASLVNPPTGVHSNSEQLRKFSPQRNSVLQTRDSLHASRQTPQEKPKGTERQNSRRSRIVHFVSHRRWNIRGKQAKNSERRFARATRRGIGSHFEVRQAREILRSY